MASKVQYTIAAEADLRSISAYTRRNFGQRQYEEYWRLLKRAVRTIAADPSQGRLIPELHPTARTYRLSRLKRQAPHVILYRVNDRGVVVIARILHASMDLGQHVSEDL